MDESGYVEVNLAALTRNYAAIGRAAAGAQIGAVVKANAYGLGIQRVSEQLYAAGCRVFLVATLEEAIELRGMTTGAKDDVAVYVFEGCRASAVAAMQRQRLIPVLNTLEQIDSWRGTKAPCAIHVDTGMNRLGLSLGEFEAFCAGSQLQAFDVRYLMTHFACADDAQHALNAEQLRRFARVRELVGNIPVSLANSAAAFLDESYHGALVRTGISLFGGNALSGAQNPAQAVATLYARVLQIRQIGPGDSVGYGATYTADSPRRIAILGVGYADGYLRCLGDRADAWFAGRRLPLIGRVSMELACIDISALSDSEIGVGDYVELFGPNVTVDEVAAHAGTIGYELLTRLGDRLPRVYVE